MVVAVCHSEHDAMDFSNVKMAETNFIAVCRLYIKPENSASVMLPQIVTIVCVMLSVIILRVVSADFLLGLLHACVTHNLVINASVHTVVLITIQLWF